MHDQSEVIRELEDQLKKLIQDHGDDAEEVKVLKDEIQNLKSSKKENVKVKEKRRRIYPYYRRTHSRRLTISNAKLLNGLFIIFGIGFIFYALFQIMNYYSSGEDSNPYLQLIGAYAFTFGLSSLLFYLGRKNNSAKKTVIIFAFITLYFITFFSFSYFNILSFRQAFYIITLFSAFLTIFSLIFKKPFFTYVGIAGLYLFAFHLSFTAVQASFFFKYASALNLFIVIILFFKKWQKLFYAVVGASWLISIFWIIMLYSSNLLIFPAFKYTTFFYLLFFLTYIAFRYQQKKKSGRIEINLIIFNTLLYFTIGILLLYLDSGERYLGFFTITNFTFQALVSLFFIILKRHHVHLFHITAGKALVFLALSMFLYIPEAWFSLFLTFSGAMLFITGRVRQTAFSEKFSYFFFFAAILSFLLQNPRLLQIITFHAPAETIIPIANTGFLTSLLITGLFATVTVLMKNPAYPRTFSRPKWFTGNVPRILPGIVLLFIYITFIVEIDTLLNLMYSDFMKRGLSDQLKMNWASPDSNLLKIKFVWYINFTIICLTILSAFLQIKIKKAQPAKIMLFANTVVLFLFLFGGLFLLRDMRIDIFSQIRSGISGPLEDYLLFRYLSVFFVSLMIFASYRYVKRHFMRSRYAKIFNIVFHIAVLILLSSELLQWMDYFLIPKGESLGLTILFLLYTFFLFGYGLISKRIHILILSFVLAGITGLKLVLFDMKQIDTLTQTLLFMVFGMMFLLFSMKSGFKQKK
jgi:hypothetical protein